MRPFFQTSRQYVLATLRAEILGGHHKVGTPLRQEEIAKRLQLSTTPVREAFRDLLAEGLVSIGPHKGVVTRALTARDVREIYELRIVLEPMLAARAAPLITPAQLDGARAEHQRMCEVAAPEDWASMNEVFHSHLVESQNETRLFDIVGKLARISHPYVVLSMHMTPEIIQRNNQEHLGLLEAYQMHDAGMAAARTREHLSNTLETIIRCAEFRTELAEAAAF
jgi:DNA-binding GntR family transcriptional regulator